MRQTHTQNAHPHGTHAGAQARSAITAGKLLDTNPEIAIEAMIKITKSLVILSEKEAQALATSDYMAIAILQGEKEALSRQYVQYSKEFRDRLEDFRHVSRAKLDKLETLQKELGDTASRNNSSFERIQKRARKTTESSLITAQELSQNHRVAFVQDLPQVEKGDKQNSAQSAPQAEQSPQEGGAA